jgi:hypothetical protein
MGFTPFPYAIRSQAVDYTYQTLEQSADLVSHHLDDGVPWQEALTNGPFHKNMQDDWNYRKARTLPSQKVFLSVSPLSFSRTTLASYRAETTQMPLPAPWNSYSFNHPDVKKAYLSYCKRSIDFFEPDYFVMGVEVNLLLKLNPTLWNDYLELHGFIYQELKKAYPILPIAISVTGIDLLEGYTEADHAQQMAGFSQLINQTDFLGISFYPYQTKYVTGPLPEDMFRKLFALTSKPMAFTETGYPAQKFSIRNNEVTFEGTENKQNDYVSRLLKESAQANVLFVVNFVLRDYDELWQSIGGKDDITILWRDTGLIDENGKEREAFQTWKSYLAKPKK